MEKIYSDPENFLKDFHIPDYLLIPGSKGEYLRHVPACTVVVFINSRSGGQLGGDLLITYLSILNPNQVYDLNEETPDNVLHRLFLNLEKFKTNEDAVIFKVQKRLRIIVAGGDGNHGETLLRST